jgi:transcriptional regulator with XRE-family HTH domain
MKPVKQTPKLPELELIGKKLKVVRKLKGYNNYEHLAFELEMSRSAYSRIENGANFELKTLIKICKLLGVTLEDFFQGINLPQPLKIKKNKG